MQSGTSIAITGLGAFAAMALAAFSNDTLFSQHFTVLAIVLAIATIIMLRLYDYTSKQVLSAPQREAAQAALQTEYMDEVVRYAVVATTLWGVVGFLVGVVAAAQLAWPVLNIEPYFNFGRIRPLHTSAVIFAFGGTALIAASFYIVQRTCRARLWGGGLAWFVFWGYQLFILMAATGYLLGITQSKEYAEPEWYVDLWLAIVWVCFLVVFLGTIVKRKEPHIYVANWFLLSFIVTVAMLHVVNGLSLPVSLLGSKSY
ncbi:MAG: cbb3-type cytochrome c oxidase subunit I, partial [Pseudomonadota bacterium]